ncbi:MAG: nucleotide exchange factor GrpE [Deltaproteobacteria bacterium]|nr:nucleotide exchange factor GrpE [Deltaproteobacteria bacterium]
MNISGRKKDKHKGNEKEAALEQSNSEDDSLAGKNGQGLEEAIADWEAAEEGFGPGVANPAAKSEVEELRAEVDGLKKINTALQEQMLRVRAEAENFRKRMQREKDDFARFAREGFVRELLPVKDNLERALVHAGDDPAVIVDGVKLILEQFESVFKAMGVECVECLGAPFDPAFHEAMTQVESDEHEPNTVVNELQRGYQLHGRLLRPALVAVAKAKSAEKG